MKALPLYFKIILFAILVPVLSFAQPQIQVQVGEKEKEKEELKAPEKVEVKPTTRDDEIRVRLQDILNATGWFVNPNVRVQDGVVFLTGETKNPELKKWAGDLARNTRDVTAVVNKMELQQPSIWDSFLDLRSQGEDFVRALPSVLLGLIILIIAWLAAKLVAKLIRFLLRHKFEKSLLREVIARVVSVGVFLIGIYIVFEMADLTNIALTILGGTGLLGIVLGIAFRDITENLLASVLLSIQHPFRTGDLVELSGFVGYVQRLTMRVTVLMTLEGNHVQIPNATVYKSNIRNFSSNPNRREEFIVGIDAKENISDVQEIALKVLSEHSAVLKDPEPWVLVDHFGRSSINLKIYFWIDGHEHSWLKVRSSVLRLVKRAFQAAGVSMPDEGRERIFPEPIAVELIKAEEAKREMKGPAPTEEPEIIATTAEDDLSSEAEEIQEQSQKSRLPEKGKDFLRSNENQKKDSNS